ncbi:MAG: phosphotransferase [Acidobacteriota bacterium]|nr:phosphotransferase [Blastocatellia bacterium]MDW8238185.1 phosphotransferase [Acidobacteriota bacterium]
MPTPIETEIKRFAACALGGVATANHVVKLAGDASSRQYFRVTAADGKTYVVARYPEPFDPIHHPTIQTTRLFLAAGLPVPKILALSDNHQLMLLDDLGDMRLQDWLMTTKPDAHQSAYRQTIDLIIRIQEAQQLATTLDCIAARIAFDQEKLQWELAFFYQNFFQRYLGLQHDADLKQRLFDEFTEIACTLASLPRVLCHRDFHSRNLMLHDHRWFIIDHQDARMGPVFYDLASLLGDPYVELDESFCKEMLHYFVAQRRQKPPIHLVPDQASALNKEYNLMLVQRLLKAAGTYAYQMTVLGNSVYLPYIPRALKRAFAAIHQLDGYPTLKAELERLLTTSLPSA